VSLSLLTPTRQSADAIKDFTERSQQFCPIMRLWRWHRDGERPSSSADLAARKDGTVPGMDGMFP
jgi:hypothetical protein